MDHLSTLLNKFRLILPPDKEIREICRDVCSKRLGRDIPLSAFRVVHSSVHIDLPPLLKSEILLHKDELLRALRQTKAHSKHIKNVR